MQETKFKIRMVAADGNWLKGVINTGQIAQELFLVVDQEKMVIANLDPNHIQFYRLEIYPVDCPEYGCSEPVKTLIDSEELIKVFKRWRAGYDIIFTDTGDYSLKIIFDNHKGVTKEFSIKYIEANYDQPQEPPLALNNKAGINIKDFKEALGDLESITDKFTIAIPDEDNILLSAEAEHGDLKINLPATHYQAPEKARSIMSLKAIKDSVRFLHNKSQLILEVGTNTPLITRTELGRDSFMHIYTAPRIEVEE